MEFKLPLFQDYALSDQGGSVHCDPGWRQPKLTDTYCVAQN